ncbi:MAG: PocR ligand-binding domain-containing protein [Desulfuromusa sp.]|jgi:PAS domain S-box-containing protein|nr:PocR ligand-binding domain-containing protein [Desulfuromusa sp.]
MHQSLSKNFYNLAPLRTLLQSFSMATGFATTLVDHESQDILFQAGWRNCCLKFHQSSPDFEKDCKENYRILASHVHSSGEVATYQCNKNLMVGGTPIIISGQRIADLVVGQVLFAPPDRETFRAQAKKYAYPEKEYLESLAGLPVINKDIFELTLRFLANIATFILQSNPTHLDFLCESLSQFAGKLVSLDQIVNLCDTAIFISDAEGKILQINQSAIQLSGYPQNELIGQNIVCLFPTNKLSGQPLKYDLLKNGKATQYERKIRTKDGKIIDIEISCKKLSNGHFQSFFRDISEHKSIQKSLLNKQCDLKTSQGLLKETNIALRVMVREAEQDKRDFEEKVSTNLLGMVNPYLEKLKKTALDSSQKNYLKIIEASLNNIISPFVRTSVAMNLKLSPAEIRIANLLKQEMTSKEIAGRLILSPQTVDKHRGNIRKKSASPIKKPTSGQYWNPMISVMSKDYKDTHEWRCE